MHNDILFVRKKFNLFFFKSCSGSYVTSIEYERRIHNIKRTLGLVDCDFNERKERISKTGSEYDTRNQLFGKTRRTIL